MHPEMRRTALIEDLNRLACENLLEPLRDDPARAREHLQRLRWIDTTELARYQRDGWLSVQEGDLIERFAAFAASRLGSVPDREDPVGYARRDPDWQIVRERAVALLEALDGFVDLGVPGWGHQFA